MLTAIFAVFTQVISWMRESLTDVVELFWDSTASELTFFGILAITALGISIFFLLIRVVQNFLHFRS